MDTQKLKQELQNEENFVRHAYQCSQGYWTIGYGRLIDKRRGGGISQQEAEYLLENDIREKLNGLRKTLPWFDDLSDARQRALLNMAFQMGVEELLNFKNTLTLMRQGQFEQASKEALKSAWAEQTPQRAARVTEMIRNG